jgi:hypothetical protein
MRVMMNKKLLLIIIVMIVVAVGAVVIFLATQGPPVDISGIEVSGTRTARELFPSTIAGKHLNEGSIVDMDQSGTFGAEYTIAEYEDVKVNIFKAESDSHAYDILGNILHGWYEDATVHVRINNWFTANSGTHSVFYWQSGIWVFGIDAQNDDVRNQAARDFIQYIKSS